MDESLGLYVVCDGMGGMASGEVASASAVATILETFTASAASGAPVSTRLLGAIDAANRTVWQHGQAPEHKGMGTTVVVAALDGKKLVIGNVGDSRADPAQGGQCMQLTVDHSYVNEFNRNGTLTVESAHHADLNGMESVITRAIGAGPDELTSSPSNSTPAPPCCLPPTASPATCSRTKSPSSSSIPRSRQPAPTSSNSPKTAAARTTSPASSCERRRTLAATSARCTLC